MTGPVDDDYREVNCIEVETLEHAKSWDVVEREVSTNAWRSSVSDIKMV